MPFVIRRFLRGILRAPSLRFRIAMMTLTVLAFGTTGFLYFELPTNPQLDWFDAVWYAIVTVTTVGYGDYAPVSVAGRYLVAMPLMFFGIGLLGYILSVSASALIVAKTKTLRGLGSYKMKNHVVIFNFPGLDKVLRVLEELEEEGRFDSNDEPVILIDEDLTEIPDVLAERGVQFVRGNPTRDETLTRASLDTATHAVLLSKRTGDPSSDALNVAITLAVEGRIRRVRTVVECVDYATEELLRKAGCDSIVCTSRFDAHFIGKELFNPGTQDVIEQLTSTRHGQQVYIVPVESEGGAFSDLSARCRELGHLAFGVQSGETTQLNPRPDRRVARGEFLVTIGPKRLTSL